MKLTAFAEVAHLWELAPVEIKNILAEQLQDHHAGLAHYLAGLCYVDNVCDEGRPLGWPSLLQDLRSRRPKLSEIVHAWASSGCLDNTVE